MIVNRCCHQTRTAVASPSSNDSGGVIWPRGVGKFASCYILRLCACMCVCLLLHPTLNPTFSSSISSPSPFPSIQDLLIAWKPLPARTHFSPSLRPPEPTHQPSLPLTMAMAAELISSSDAVLSSSGDGGGEDGQKRRWKKLNKVFLFFSVLFVDRMR